jgi:hypothetical protein
MRDTKTGDRKGVCKICQTEYTIEEWGVCHDSHVTYHHYNPCPSCSYTPEIEEFLERVLEKDIKVTLTTRGLSINHKELSDKILEGLEKIWPRPK